MKIIYTLRQGFVLVLILTTQWCMAQQVTTVVPSVNCNFTYTFNTTDEGFSSPSIYSDANDFGLYWNGSLLQETIGSGLSNRTASTISGIYFNTEPNRTTLGFDYTVPAGTEYRIRVISGVTNPPLEILATTANGPLWTPFPSTAGSLCLELQDMDLPLGAQIRYEFTFRTVNQGAITFDNFRRLTFNAPLPVTFLGFIARETPSGSLNLIWNVAEEQNVRGYEVESSMDGINFTTLGFVNANGKDNYYFPYPGTFRGVRYFRVRNIDFDNNFKYTGIIRVQNDQPDAAIKIYPVPATDQVYIEHKKQTLAALITVVSSDGKVVSQLKSQPNSYQTSININGLQRGIYFVKYDEGNGFIQTLRFVKN